MHVKQVFFRTGRSIRPSDARRLVAEAMDDKQNALLSLLMNYEPTSKKTITGFPKVHFGYHHAGFSMMGFGDDGATILADAAPLIHSAISSKLNTLVQIEQREVELSAERRPYPLQYIIPRMVVQKKAHQTEWMKNPELGKAHLEGLVMRSLQRQAEAVGLSLPQDIIVTFKGAADTFAVKQDNAQPLAFLSLKNAAFDINLRLGGIWAAGYLLSKGYGHFDATFQLANPLDSKGES